MTKTEVINAVLNGEKVTVVEYRGSNAEIIKWSDRETQKQMEAPSLRHTVEDAKTSFVVSERLDRTKPFDAAAYKSPFKKGDKVALRFNTVVVNKGVTTVTGTLEPFDSTK